MSFFAVRHPLSILVFSICLAVVSLLGAQPLQAQTQTKIPALAQAIAEAAVRDGDIAAFYRETGYRQIWTGTGGKDRGRRQALLRAIAKAADHGLPENAYKAELLKTNMRAVKSPRDLGRLEVELSRIFLLYARHMQTGVVTPGSIDPLIVRKVPLRNRTQLLAAFAKSSPAGFLKKLEPTSPEYKRLMKEKIALEKLIGKGGWGPEVPRKSLKPGASGNAVVALRNRLIAMGYLRRTSTQSYDGNMQRAVQLFQLDHGLNPDGVAGAGTMKQINVSAAERLRSVIVAMERERWMNGVERGKRHVWVNLAAFEASIVDNGKTTFKTRVVVGKNTYDRRSPEFSDMMEHMVVNPTWNVPRSIAVKEYLPQLQKNPNAAGHLRIIDVRGQVVSRDEVDFTQYSTTDFPFDLKQPPSRRNALGLVKFMFPNSQNVYLHDTPAKNLFSRDMRAYSHGCIRLQEPFDFAYTLLAKQSRDPEGEFKAALNGGIERVIPLEKFIPVHLIYRTAFSQAKGRMNYRDDVYGRDARIFAAMAKAGVVLRAVRG